MPCPCGAVSRVDLAAQAGRNKHNRPIRPSGVTVQLDGIVVLCQHNNSPERSINPPHCPFSFCTEGCGGAVVVERERPCQSRSHKIQQPVSFAFGPSCNRAPFGSAAKRYSTGTPENSNTICTTVGLVKYPTGRFGAWCIALVHPRPRFCCFAAQRILHHLHRLVSTHVPFRPASSVLAGSARCW